MPTYIGTTATGELAYITKEDVKLALVNEAMGSGLDDYWDVQVVACRG